MREYGKRDPSSHRTLDQVHQMDSGYNHSSRMISRRSNDNKARKMLGLKVGDKRDAGHIKSQARGGSTSRGNLEPQSRDYNRGWRRRGSKP